MERRREARSNMPMLMTNMICRIISRQRGGNSDRTRTKDSTLLLLPTRRRFTSGSRLRMAKVASFRTMGRRNQRSVCWGSCRRCSINRRTRNTWNDGPFLQAPPLHGRIRRRDRRPSMVMEQHCHRTNQRLPREAQRLRKLSPKGQGVQMRRECQIGLIMAEAYPPQSTSRRFFPLRRMNTPIPTCPRVTQLILSWLGQTSCWSAGR
mmetsp:Transcript_15924/g.45787  ORF Transcript_15924/g.45787 Transcript_15924/m.45787 type:complete len:207 (+) Transcript_15924:957-1577(+)